jgi:hypothetical protein
MVVTGHVVPHNTATAVRGPKYVVNTGKTPVLDKVEPQTGPGGGTIVIAERGPSRETNAPRIRQQNSAVIKSCPTR